jgi:hypothetical protein
MNDLALVPLRTDWCITTVLFVPDADVEIFFHAVDILPGGEG